ncbi:YfhO family protein [Flavilitoribacter nigricans]|uniref:YfhO family protein n=1 Tax=Flavilitoribacter nigricans (strain ATCC 23147 / DSM 23189 / NBRC 102662 / NCIMB 1420 / SS-2) TaxID=1122177 RepID=A0A2D0N1L9_FLAN2|nr:YfhO family protein [Flavilitoribacter nigricans]PHN02395.1 hypothetical protein CRP01_31940 [Flavilitoribacter nigricans DSM 23189 = NBRC 102662]
MFNKLLPYISAVFLFLIISVIYFYPQFQGLEMPKGDLTQWRGMVQEIKNYKAETGKDALWTNAMFGGMPTYQIDSIRKGNGLTVIQQLARLGIPSPAGLFFVGMLSFFVMLVVLRVNTWLAIVGAIAFGLTTNNLVLFEAGHISKLMAILYLPLVIAGMILVFRKRYLLGGAIFALGTGLNLWASHPQMSYYFVLTTVFFGIAELVKAIREKQLPDFLKAVGTLVIGGLLALGSAASNILPTLEYAEDTMRGKPILEAAGGIDPGSSSQTEGLAWDYAMQWSNATIDLFSSFIPGVAGGATNEPVSRDSEIGRELTRRGAQLPPTFALPLYWGGVGSTSGPIYFGAIAFFFFFMGLTLVKGPVKWWLALGVLLTFLLSMGANLEWFNRFIFEYIPLYNKFRTPNSVLSVTAVLVPALGFMAVNRIIKGEVSTPEVMRSLLISGGILGAICLFFLLLGPSMFDFTHPSDPQRAQNIQPELLIAMRKSLMQSDALRSLILIGLSAAGIWAFIQNKLDQKWLMLGLGALVLFDMWGVGRRYLNEDSFYPKRAIANTHAPRPVDTQILQDQALSFRVLDLTEPTFVSTRASYYHKSIGGNHAAKLQRIEDIIQHHIQQGNQAVLDMLNTKYFIQPGPDDQATAVVNPGALGNAWFVSDLEIVPNANAEIDALTDFDPSRTAVVNTEFQDYVSGLNPNGTGTIELTAYAPDKLTYTSNTSGEQLAVFSEVWYGPDKGWKAYIDGEPLAHIRVNYLLRALRVPAGQHTIVFEFSPGIYKAGVAISLISSLIIILGILGLAAYYAYGFWQNLQHQPATKVTTSQKAKRTVARKKKK